MDREKRTLRVVEEERAFRRADRVADRLGKALAALLVAFARKVRDATDETLVAEALAINSPDLLDQSLDWGQSALEAERVLTAFAEESPAEQKAANPLKGIPPSELLRLALESGLDLGLGTLPEEVAAELLRGELRLEARRAMKRTLARHAQEYLVEMRRAQRSLVSLATAKRPTSQLSKDLSAVFDGRTVRRMTGLNRQQTQTLVKKAQALLNKEVAPYKIRDQILKDYQRALKQRADVAARAMVSEAQNAAQLATWKRAKRKGLLEGWFKEWVTRGDDDVCERCWSLDGQRVELDGKFESELVEPISSPEIHLRGRCRMRLYRRYFRRAA